MKNADFLTYTERPTANANIDPSGDDALIESVRNGRDKAAALLKSTTISQEARDFAERHLAKANRWLRKVEGHRQQFNQDRLLAKLRQS